MNRTSFISTFIVIFFSAIIWWQGTDGFRAFTSETARRLEVLENPKVVSHFDFENQFNKKVNFADYQGKIVLIDFIYTNCPDICHTLGFAFESIRSKLKDLNLEGHIQIVNITFDQKHDTPEKLAAYINRYTKKTTNWNGLRLKNPQKLAQLLADFAVVVIPDNQGGFNHNAAIHLLDQNGRLFGIYDHQAHDQIIDQIRNKISSNL